MAPMTAPHRLLTVGTAEAVAAIAARLIAGGAYVAAEHGVDAVLIDGTDSAVETPFLDLADSAFAAQLIDATLGRVAALQTALEQLAPAASIVVIGTDAHLGRWHATGQAAASAALVGIVRSVAMEYGRHGVRANLVALPLGTTAADEPVIADAAIQAAALFDALSITGETVLVDGGNNLKFRQARRR